MAEQGGKTGKSVPRLLLLCGSASAACNRSNPMFPVMLSCCVPQGVGPATVCGGSPARDGSQGVRSHDHLPQQGAVGREQHAGAGQPPQRRHRPAAKLRGRVRVIPHPLVVWLSNCSPVKPAAPSEGGENTDLCMDL